MWRPCLLKLSGALGEAESALVRGRRREGLLEGPADGRLPDVERLDLVDLHLRARLELAPAELGEIAGPAHARRRRREERLRAEQVTQRRLGLGVDLADEQRVRADLPADLVERRHEERRAPHPLAVPLLVEGGVEGVAARAQQWTRTLLRGRVRIREHVERRDANERGAVAARDALPRRYRHTQAGERSGPDRDRDAIDRRESGPGRKERALDR